MKVKIKITAFMLAALFLTVGCDNSLFPRGGNGNGEKNDLDKYHVPYIPCPCENEPITTIQGEILFENQNYPNYVPLEDFDTDRHRYSERLIFNGIRNVLALTDNNPNMSKLCSLNGKATFNICNFPEFAEQWNSGITVYFEGIVYPHCEQFGCRGICYSLILTKLKKVE